jgi:hypothetical protein
MVIEYINILFLKTHSAGFFQITFRFRILCRNPYGWLNILGIEVLMEGESEVEVGDFLCGDSIELAGELLMTMTTFTRRRLLGATKLEGCKLERGEEQPAGKRRKREEGGGSLPDRSSIWVWAEFGGQKWTGLR